MIEFDNCIFVHIPKTGGTFLRHAIGVAQLKEIVTISKKAYFWHCGLSDINTKNKPAFVSVRDPIGWYKSWLSFLNKPEERDPVFAALSNNYTLSNDEIMMNALMPSAEIFAKIDELIYMWPANGAHVAFYPEDFKKWKKDEGFYSFLTRRLLDREWDTQGADYSNIDIIGQDINGGFLKVLSKYFVEPDEKFKARIFSTDKINTANRKVLLSKEIEDLILEREKFTLSLIKENR
jgi:hypothetical protein